MTARELKAIVESMPEEALDTDVLVFSSIDSGGKQLALASVWKRHEGESRHLCLFDEVGIMGIRG